MKIKAQSTYSEQWKYSALYDVPMLMGQSKVTKIC